MNAERRAILMMLLFGLCWAVVEEIAAHVLRQYSPYQVVWTRYGVHLAFMLAIWGWRDPGVLVRTRRPAYQLARSLLMLVMPGAWIAAIQVGAGGSTFMSLFWLTPLVIVGLARVFLGERIGTSTLAGAGAATAGAFLVFGVHGMAHAWWVAFPLAMALSFSGYVVMTRPLRHEDVRANLFYSALGVFLVLTPAMPALWTLPNLHDLGILAAIGLLGFVALYALDRAAAAAPVSITAPVVAMHILFTALVALGHGVPGRRALLGLLVIGGVAAIAWVRAANGARPVPESSTA